MGIRGDRRLYIALGLFGLAGLLNMLQGYAGPDVRSLVFVANFAIYTGVIIAWGISVHRRLLPSELRRYPVLSVFLMVLWMLLRVLRYRLAPGGTPLDRLSWYAYYIPQSLLPLLFFFSALCVRMPESYRPARAWRLLLIPAALLILVMLTNDLHELAFRFPAGPGPTEVYSRGPAYYAVIVWNAGLFLGAVALISAKVRLSPARRRLWQVLIWLAGYAAYLGLLVAVESLLPAGARIRLPYQYPEISCFTMIAVWESCIRTHLIPSNTEYPYFFAHASVAAQIVDDRGQAVFRAEDAPVLTARQMAAAAEGPVLLDRDTRLSGRAIHGGHVYWTDSLADLNRRRDELAAVGVILSEEMNLLSAENRLRRREAHIRERTAIYESVADAVQPQLDRLHDLFSGAATDGPDARRRLAEACVYGAYIKRRANLVLLAADTDDIPAGELTLCVRESLSYLRLCGADCALTEELAGALPAREALVVYDFLEWAVERSLPGLRALLVRLGTDGGLSARILLEAEPAGIDAPWDDERLAALRADCRLAREDDGLLLELLLPKGGGAA